MQELLLTLRSRRLLFGGLRRDLSGQCDIQVADGLRTLSVRPGLSAAGSSGVEHESDPAHGVRVGILHPHSKRKPIL